MNLNFNLNILIKADILSSSEMIIWMILNMKMRSKLDWENVVLMNKPINHGLLSHETDAKLIIFAFPIGVWFSDLQHYDVQTERWERLKEKEKK